MAVYTNDTSLNLLLGSGLVSDLVDLDEDGSPDAGVLDDVIGDVSSEIDGELSERYSVPFADIGDATPTPRLIQTIAKYLAAARLLVKRTEMSEQRDAYDKYARNLLKKLRERTMSVPGLSELDADEAAQGFAYNESENTVPTFAGYDPDEDDADRMERW